MAVTQLVGFAVFVDVPDPPLAADWDRSQLDDLRQVAVLEVAGVSCPDICADRADLSSLFGMLKQLPHLGVYAVSHQWDTGGLQGPCRGRL